MYQQATRSNAGTMGLLFIFLLDVVMTIPGAYIMCGRMLWTLGRDEATPFSGWVGRISPRWRNQFNATLVCGCTVTVLGAIYVASVEAFQAILVRTSPLATVSRGCEQLLIIPAQSVFCIFTTMSYFAAIFPHILFRRQYVIPGPFYMSGIKGYIVIGIACAYIIIWNIMFCFPYSLPNSVATMVCTRLVDNLCDHS